MLVADHISNGGAVEEINFAVVNNHQILFQQNIK
jgi:hypothetical protein